MRLTRLFMSTAAAVTAFTASSSIGLATSAPRNASSSEVRRIRTHFDSVLATLASRDLSALTASRRAHRAALIATLRDYRERGVFPHNADGHRTTVSTIGVVSGIATVALGSVVLTKPGVAREVGASSVAVGLLSVALSARAMHNHSTIVAAREGERARAVAQTTISPIVSATQGGSAGVSVSMRF